VEGESDGDDVREVPAPKRNTRSTAASRKPKAKPMPQREEEDVVVEEEEEQRAISVEGDEDNDVEVLDHMPAKNMARWGSKNPAGASGGVNGHAKGATAAAKGKGKAKAKAKPAAAATSSKSRVLKQEKPEVMDIDSIYGPMEVEEQEMEVEEIEDQHLHAVPAINAVGKSGVKGGRTAQASQHVKSLEEMRLRERLRQVCARS